MTKRKGTAIFFFTLFSLLTVISCGKDKDNINPTIRFIQPGPNLVIEQDTILVILVDARDSDGDVRKVELLINGSIVREFDSPPYQYEWYAKLENEGVHTMKARAYDDKGATGQEEISIEINDFRTKYLGDYYFKVIKQSWRLGQPETYDTSFHNGKIRRYELMDSENDMYIDDDGNEDFNKKITIQFKQNTIITSILNIDGSLVAKTGHHYNHFGGFTDKDTISFVVGGMGGLGGGWSYIVEGFRK